LAHGRAASFARIARREGKVGRHIRLLAPLAFVSPRIVSALLDGTAPADLTLTKLARARCPIAGLSRSGECIFSAFAARSIKFPVTLKKFPVMAAKIPYSVV
jgi:hypothetical protein